MRLLHRLVRLLLFVCLGKYYSLLIRASQPASCSAHTWSDPRLSIILLQVDETTTFPAIRLRISPTPIGRSPWFLSKGIIPHAMRSSKEDPSSFSKHSYLVKDAIAPQRSAELPPNQFEANILRQPSASSPDGLNLKLIFYASHQHLAPLVLIAALRTSSAVISSYLVGWKCWASSGSKIIGSGAKAWGCWRWCHHSKGQFRDSCCRLEVSMLHSRFPSAFLPETFWKSEALLLILSFISSFFKSSDSPEVIPIGHLIAKVPSFRWSFDLLSFEGFCRSKLGIIIAPVIAIFFKGESSIHALNSFVNSLMNNLTAFPTGKINRYFF